MKDVNQKILRITAILCALLLAPLAAAASAPLTGSGGSGAALQSILAPQPGCDHNFKKQTERVWVPPKKAIQLVGYDKKGKPIYKEVQVRAGYYKTISVMKCTKCGKTKK